MKKEVEISISGLHTGEESTNVETRVYGEYFQRDKTHYLFYEDTMEEGHSMEEKHSREERSGEKVRTRLTFREKKLELTRQGQVNTRMVFEEGKRHSVNYATPYGSLLMEIEASLVSLRETGEGLQITAKYTIFIEEKPFSDSELAICIREK